MNERKREAGRKAVAALDRLNQGMGRDTVKGAAMKLDHSWLMRQERESKCYTTRWADLLEVGWWTPCPNSPQVKWMLFSNEPFTS